MAKTLQSILAVASAAFIQDVIAQLGDLPLNELTNLSGKAHVATVSAKEPKVAKAKTTSTGRMARRDPESLKAVIDDIVRTLSTAKEGMRSEQLQEALSLDKKEITRPIVLALEGGLIHKTGNKRSTCYFVGGGAQTGAKRAAKAAKTKPAKKAAKPATKRAAKPKGAKAARKSKGKRTHVEVVPENATKDAAE